MTGEAREQGQEVGGGRRHAASWLAWSVCATILTVLGLSVLLIFLGWSTPLPGGWTPWGGQLIGAAGGIGAPILGGLIASRRPGNPYGWLWLGVGLAVVLITFTHAYAAYALEVEPGFLPAPRTVGDVVAGGAWTVALASVPFLLLLFPTGRLPSRRWRFVTWAVALAGALALIVGPFDPVEDGFLPGKNPLGVGGTIGEAIDVLLIGAVIVVLIAIVPSALSLVLRYRRAGGVERQQLKWFAYAAVVWIASFLVQFFYEPPGAWDALYETVLGAGLYVAVGVAILKHRLYDIDILINRTLVYGSLTAMLVVVYFGGVAGLQRLLSPVMGEGNGLAVVASTLAIAALFNPLRRRVQALVDRRFYRRKYDAAKTLEAFGSRLRDQTNLDALSNDMVRVAETTVQPAHVFLWLRPERKPEARSAALRQFGQDE